MGCCQSENRPDELDMRRGSSFYVRPAVLEQRNYAGSTFQNIYTPVTQQNGETANFNTERQEKSRNHFDFRKQLSEIRELDPHMEQSIQHIERSISKSRAIETTDPYLESIKEQSFYKSPKNHEITSVKPFGVEASPIKYQGQLLFNQYNFSLPQSPSQNENNLQFAQYKIGN